MTTRFETIVAALVWLLAIVGCDTPLASTFHQGAGTGGSTAGPDAAPDASGLDGAAPSSGCGVTDAATGVLRSQQIVVGSNTRTYVLSVPVDYSPTKPYALVFGWHWYGDSGIGAASSYHLESSDGTGNKRAIFVYPDGMQSGGAASWNLSAAGIDVALFDALVAQISATYCVDMHRIFSTGMSAGAYFTNALGCYRGNVLRAIAPASGGPLSSSVACTGSVAAWIAHAENDTTVNFTSGGVATRDFWLARNGCSSSTVPDPTTPACVDYQGCRDGLPVAWCVHDNAHTWPNTTSNCTGSICFDAGPAIWNFFSSLGPKPASELTDGATSVLDAGSQFDPDAKGAKPGSYAVGHINYIVADPATYARRVGVSVWYPADPATVSPTTTPAQYPIDPLYMQLPVVTSTDFEANGYDPAYEELSPSGDGPFPLVMVSGAWTIDNLCYLYIGTRLASHGYVVVSLEYDTDGEYDWIPKNSAPETMYNRTRDTSFAITELLAKTDTTGELLHGTIDPSQIAMTGHLLGGHTAYALAGGDDEVCDALFVAHYQSDTLPYSQSTCVPAAPDPRIQAIVTLDGFSQLLRYEELARISVPSLIIGSTPEHLVTNYTPPNVLDPSGRMNARAHAAIHRGDSYRVDAPIVASTYSFMNTDIANDPTTHQIVTTYMLAFLNTVFGRADDAWMLTADYAAQKQPNVEFFDSEACDASLSSDAYYTYRPQPGQCEVAPQDPADYFLTDSAVPGFQIQAQGYVVTGSWSGYAFPAGVTSGAAGAATTTIAPADFSSVAAGTTELCVQGSIGAASDYSGLAMIGVDVNQAEADPDAGADAGTPPIETVAIGGSGITVRYTNPGGTQIRVQIHADAGNPTTRWCANLSGLGGTETVPWAAFWGGVADATQGCWNSGGSHPPVGTAISGVALLVPGDSAAAVPYDFCLQGIAEAP